MRLRNVKNKTEILNDSKILIINNVLLNNLFNNNNPIYLEIGIGKGKFLLENALTNQNINYIGIEKSDSILVKAVKKIEKHNLNNLLLMKLDAKHLNDILKNRIDLLFLNFSDPWPKKRHEKRRLTSKEFLVIYDTLFKDKKRIILKTDNKDFFEYSIVSLSNHGYIFEKVLLDLHNSNEFNITTEYEEKFMKKGKVIYKLECVKK